MRRSSSASTRQTRARATTTLSGATFSVTPVDAEAEPLISEATDAAGDVDLSNPPLRSIPITRLPRRRRRMGSSSTRKPLPSTSTPMARCAERRGSCQLHAGHGRRRGVCAHLFWRAIRAPAAQDRPRWLCASRRLVRRDGAVRGGVLTSESVQTDAQGTAQLASLLIPGQTYTLAETDAPTGYQPLAGSALFAHLANRRKEEE